MVTRLVDACLAGLVESSVDRAILFSGHGQGAGMAGLAPTAPVDTTPNSLEVIQPGEHLLSISAIRLCATALRWSRIRRVTPHRR
jgi:hypothetical protein